MSDIIKPDDKQTPAYAEKGGKIKFASKTQSFHDRVNANRLGSDGTSQQDEYADLVPNRIGLMPDCSGSMHGEKEQHLRSACEEFIRSCDFSNTSVAIRTFGLEGAELRGPLSRSSVILNTLTNQLRATGGTPMLACLRDSIENLSMTRGLVISDGSATDWIAVQHPYNNEVVEKYKAAGIPVDCVHIGDSTSGEGLLKFLAEATGGLFIKFKNTGNFAQAFKYLAPAYRAMLGDGKVLLTFGADEVR